MDLPTLRFSARYRDDVASGDKRTTVRWGERVAVGPVLLTFEGPGDDEGMPGTIHDVALHALADLDAATAHQPAGTDMERFAAELRVNHYPDMPDDAVVAVVTFAVRAAS